METAAVSFVNTAPVIYIMWPHLCASVSVMSISNIAC
jgi:hypothetical protein